MLFAPNGLRALLVFGSLIQQSKAQCQNADVCAAGTVDENKAVGNTCVDIGTTPPTLYGNTLDPTSPCNTCASASNQNTEATCTQFWVTTTCALLRDSSSTSACAALLPALTGFGQDCCTASSAPLPLSQCDSQINGTYTVSLQGGLATGTGTIDGQDITMVFDGANGEASGTFTTFNGQGTAIIQGSGGGIGSLATGTFTGPSSWNSDCSELSMLLLSVDATPVWHLAHPEGQMLLLTRVAPLRIFELPSAVEATGAVVELTGAQPQIRFGEKDSPVCSLTLDRPNGRLESTCDISTAKNAELTAEVATLKANFAALETMMEHVLKTVALITPPPSSPP